MWVPDRDAIKRAVLIALEDGHEHSSREILDSVAEQLRLTKEDIAERHPGLEHQTKFENEVHWVLGDIGEGQRGTNLISKVRAKVYRITDLGRAEFGTDSRGSAAPAHRMQAGIEQVLAEYAAARRTQPYGSSA